MAECKALKDSLWWQRGTFYQIYPLSFQDSNGDGKGDLKGLLSRLDYLDQLGVDVLWLSPIYPSPMKDFGYDISNYTAVDPVFGSLETLDEVIRQVHRRSMKIVLDFVPNHTSDQHPWFKESRSSRTHPRRSWYIWRDPAEDGGAPNNWLSNFGGSAWTLDETTGQYYYHAFLKEQPDLNWRNPDVRDAMFSNMRFWLDRGIDGFRVDVIWHIIKDDQFRDNPANPDYLAQQAPYNRYLSTYTADRPEVHEIIEEMRHVLDGYDDRMMVGEIYLPISRLVTYYGAENEGVHLPFNFHLMDIPWRAQELRRVINDYYSSLPPHGWPNWVLANHDKPRLASRVGDSYVRMAAVLLLTLRGTPTLYYGDEIGMHNVSIPADKIQDPFEKNVPGLGLGRDGSRTPMQWDESTYAGFSTVPPWLPLGPQTEIINVDYEARTPDSLYSLYRRLLHLRRREGALAIGDYKEWKQENDEILAFTRNLQDADSFFVALNFGDSKTRIKLPWVGSLEMTTALSRVPPIEGLELVLDPFEAVLVRRGS